MPYFKRLLGTQEEALQEAERAKLYMTDPTPWVTAIQGDPFLRRWAWELRTTPGFLQRPHGPEIPWEHHATLRLEENAAPPTQHLGRQIQGPHRLWHHPRRRLPRTLDARSLAPTR